MTCPSCNSPLEPNARFCGVCGYRLAPSNRRPGNSAPPPQQIIERVRNHSSAPPPVASGERERVRAQPNAQSPNAQSPNAQSQPRLGATAKPAAQPQSKAAGSDPAKALHPSAGGPPAGASSPGGPAAGGAGAGAGGGSPAGTGASAQKPAQRVGPKRPKTSDDVYLGQVLNNRFKVESKIGEGGFGAVYRGVQLATGRKVALKLLHPDMTKDDNLVARFRREGMVLCNLRDAHTITTYDFDQTPSGTLYIAMELLEGKSLHQVFHEEAPLDWKRVFKVLTEMCSSLAEAHAQGIVHRDLKPENIYLEARPGNPEFVKILDFGIAKVMRGETIDPQSPQLTATGQTLGTLEYMSPEQLMGKALDGRSDVYALGVLAYEMITGRLPFPDAKGPAGLITAQLKQTPAPPSQACPQAMLPRAADRAILKCLEKDKNNRFPDVSALAAALQDAISGQSSEPAAIKQVQVPVGSGRQPLSSMDMMETRRGDPLTPPAMPTSGAQGAGHRQLLQPAGAQGQMPGQVPAGPQGQAMMNAGASGGGVPGMADRSSGLAPMGAPGAQGAQSAPGMHGVSPSQSPVMTPPVGSPMYAPMSPTPYPLAPGSPMPQRGPMGPFPHQARLPPAPMRRGKSKILWWVIALLAIGASAGTVAGLLLSK